MVHRRHVEARLEDGGALGRWAASNALDWRERMWNGAVHAFEEDASHGPGFTLVVQAEALYAFARLAATAPDGSSPMIAVAKAASALTGRFLSPDGAPGFVSGVDANDRVLDATRGLDGHAVALKALAAAIAAGVVAARPAAEVTVDFLDDELATGSEGYRETAASALPRRQASHMRLLEATLALHAATGAPAHLARAHRLFDLFRFRFGAHEAVGLVETFDRDWAPLGAGRSAPLSTAHAARWISLLGAYERASGVPTQGHARRLYEALGRCVGPDGLLAETEGGPAAPRRARTQALGIAALRVARDVWGVDASPAADALEAALLARFVDPPGGARWREEDGVAAHVDASTLGAFVDACAPLAAIPLAVARAA